MEKKLRRLFMFIFLLIPLFLSMGVSSWTIVKEETKTITTSKEEARAFIEGKEGTYYTSIDKAISVATSGENVIVIPKKTIIVDKTITIPNGKTLTIPYATYDSEGNYSGYQWNATDSEIQSATWSSFADSNSSKVITNRHTLINMTNGADIIVEEGGTLNLGGQFKTKGVAGAYCEINLDTDSSISVSGTFNCFGYVKENSASYKHANQADYQNYYNNEFDSGRYILVNSTGYLTTALLVQDLSGGSELMDIINNGTICPFNIMEFPNLQTFVEVKLGGKLDAQTRMEISTYFYNEPSPIVRNTSENALFQIVSGSLCFEYCPTNVLYSNSNAITRIYVNGSLQQGYILMEPNALASIDTSDYFLPISYKFNIYVTNQSSYSTEYKVKFLPGAKLHILDGGQVTLNNSFVFYEENSLSNVSGSGYPSTKGASEFINDGSLIFESNGAIGGLIQTTKTDTSASIDFSLISSTALTISSPEWSSQVINIVVVSTGYFDDDSAEEGKSLYQFVAGSKITSSSSGNQCWYGEKYAAFNLNITISETEYDYNVFQYQIYVADDSSGTNSTEITSGITSAASSHLIVKDKYIKIVASRYKAAEFTSGITLAFDSNTWYRFTNDTTFNIEPNEGVLIDFNGRSASGAGAAKHTISESSSSTGSFTSLPSVGAYDEVIVIKDYYFKVSSKIGTGFKNDSETGNPNYLKPTEYEYIEIQKGPEELVGLQLEESDHESRIYEASVNYKFYYEIDYLYGDEDDETSSGSCLLPNTLVTMADGTKVPVQDIQPGDMLRVFNHETGQYDVAPVLFNDYEPAKQVNVINLEFSNGSYVGVISEHGFFDLDEMKYIYIDEYNYDNYIGHRFYVDSGTEATLTRAYVTQKYTEVYSPVTRYHMNYFTEDILSMPGGIEGLFNIFEYDDNLQYNQELMQKDIEMYGLFTYDDFKDLVPYELYNSFATQYFKVAIGKGILTWEQLYYYIERYGPLVE